MFAEVGKVEIEVGKKNIKKKNKKDEERSMITKKKNFVRTLSLKDKNFYFNFIFLKISIS